MTFAPEQVAGVTTHTRRGQVRHRFRYGVDYVLIDPEAMETHPRLFSRNRFNFVSVHDIDHGGPLKAGRGPEWARDVLAKQGLAERKLRLMLLTQPRFLGYVFNPVSFWLAMDGEALIAVIAEVSTPFGDRHSYFCHRPDFGEIDINTQITSPKSLHVSPFQDVEGTYAFNFDIGPEHINIRILHRNGDEGVVATLTGPRVPMTNGKLLYAGIRRPLGALRTIALIYWQALRLTLKGAKYRSRPNPPNTEVS